MKTLYYIIDKLFLNPNKYDQSNKVKYIYEQHYFEKLRWECIAKN